MILEQPHAGDRGSSSASRHRRGGRPSATGPRAREAISARSTACGLRFSSASTSIFVSPGGYILGEETTRSSRRSSKRTTAEQTAVPVTHGLFGKPTLMNNVETYSFVPAILTEGAESWKAHGVNGATGWKFLSVSGDVAKPGVCCVPMGTTVRDLIEHHCGGMRDGKPMLAFSPGGASAPFLPASLADTPLSFEAMAKAGSMLGSGAPLIVAEGADLLALAANMVRFFRNESCGKCVPCLGSQGRGRPGSRARRAGNGKDFGFRSSTGAQADVDLRARAGGPEPGDERAEALAGIRTAA